MIITCRDCGAVGEGGPDDPAPGLCPECMEQRLAKVTAHLEERIKEVPPEVLWFEARRLLLEEVGLTPEATRKFLARD